MTIADVAGNNFMLTDFIKVSAERHSPVAFLTS
jgi:hypothetical protein